MRKAARGAINSQPCPQALGLGCLAWAVVDLQPVFASPQQPPKHPPLPVGNAYSAKSCFSIPEMRSGGAPSDRRIWDVTLWCFVRVR